MSSTKAKDQCSLVNPHDTYVYTEKDESRTIKSPNSNRSKEEVNEGVLVYITF